MMNMDTLTTVTQIAMMLTIMFCVGNILYTEIRGEGYTLSKIIGDAISRRRRAYRIAKIVAANRHEKKTAAYLTAQKQAKIKENSDTNKTFFIDATVTPIEGGRRFQCYDATEHGFEEHTSCRQ